LLAQVDAALIRGSLVGGTDHMRGGSGTFDKHGQPSLRLVSALPSHWFAPQEKFLARPPFEKARPETAAEKRERIFKEGADALSDYEVAAVNIRKNMARLRELRLAKEAADRATENAATKTTTKEVTTKGTKKRKPRHF
jgi:hypothetical protein